MAKLCLLVIGVIALNSEIGIKHGKHTAPPATNPTNTRQNPALAIAVSMETGVK
jgi:hypothetical protein